MDLLLRNNRSTVIIGLPPLYATFLKIALKIAYYVTGRVYCNLAPQAHEAHGTLLFFFRHAACSFSGKIENCLLQIEFCRG